MKIGYVRVSTKEQNTARQEELMKLLEVDRVYIDKMSGRDTERTGAATTATDAATNADAAANAATDANAAADATADADDGHADVCAAAGECTASAVPGICRRFQSDYTAREYRIDYGCSTGCYGGIGKDQQIYPGYFGVCPRYNYRVE